MAEEIPRLYLITPAVADAAPFAAPFEAALAAADIACVLLRLAADDPDESKKIVRALAPIAQARGAACLVEDVEIALATGADGVHVTRLGDALATALARLKPDRIVGAGAIASRDDAMHAGEAGVDYLMFGGEGGRQGFAEIRESIAWWAEIFNVPCVAYAHRLDEIPALADAGAEFVALGSAVWNDPRGPAAVLRDAALVLEGMRETT